MCNIRRKIKCLCRERQSIFEKENVIENMVALIGVSKEND